MYIKLHWRADILFDATLALDLNTDQVKFSSSKGRHLNGSYSPGNQNKTNTMVIQMVT